MDLSEFSDLFSGVRITRAGADRWMVEIDVPDWREEMLQLEFGCLAIMLVADEIGSDDGDRAFSVQVFGHPAPDGAMLVRCDVGADPAIVATVH